MKADMSTARGLSGACFIGLVLLLIGCAKIAPPSGGPVDRQSPHVSSYTPALDALDVALDAPVDFFF